MGEEQTYIQTGETAGKWIWNLNNVNLKKKIYSLNSKLYLPAMYKVKYVIRYAAYSTLKSKSMMFCCHHIVFFLHSLPFTNSLPNQLTRVAIWWWDQEFYFLFHAEAGFSTFYIGWHSPVLWYGWIFYLDWADLFHGASPVTQPV